MTQPDGSIPSGALSSTGLSAYAGMSQEDWEDQQLANIYSHFTTAEVAFLQILAKIPIIGDIIEIITGVEDGDTNDLGTWANNFFALVERLFFGGDIAGAFQQNLISSVSVGALFQGEPNLLVSGTFDASSVSNNPDWTYDGAVTRLADGSGSVRATADGTSKALRSNKVAVAEGQKITLEAWARWTSLTASSGAIALSIRKFLNGVEVGTETIDSIASPATNSSSHPNQFSGWVKLDHDWTVPSGVDQYEARLIVGSGATAGTVWFDDAVFKQPGLLQMPWVENLVERWHNTAQLMGITDTDLDGDIDFEDVWESLISGQLNPLGVIEDLFARSRGQSIIDYIFSGFNNFGVAGDQGNPIETVLQSIFGIFGTGLGAQSGVAAHEARIRALESSANTIVDTFTGSSATSLGGNWTQAYSGGGAGNLGLDGKGNAVWVPSGASNRTCIARYSASAITTDAGVASVVLSSTPQSYLFDDAYTYICVRMNSSTPTSATYVRLRIGYDEIRLQNVISGSASNVGTAWSGSPKAGDLIDVVFGEAGGTNLGHFVVKRNGLTIINWTDTTPVSNWGASYRNSGLGMETGNRLVLFQNIPAGLAAFTVAEVI